MNFSWATASFFIAMDLLMALSPITLIKTLNRPLREKVLVAGLMALGLLTTAAAGAKMSTFPGIYKGDVLQGQMLASLLAKLEEQIGIICACLPTLKGPAERLLIRLGVLSHELRFSRPSFVMSARRQATPTLTSRTLESSNVDSDYNSNVTTLWLDSQNSKSTKGDSGFDSLSQSSSKQSLAQGTKAPVVRVEEV
ncbi:hypothetical protein GLAREA_12092 [Glarea lozoyensis ATCC 20868]|uniref:Rhodopsin domain-containing protein n=1 Tax=Glarea lozoyensis (strain ATCC 20868 / MF5171) TaxID=1116229 RepID=S3D2F7_GLAL2|nr:uncharacterized protein GLAREA_12092 [Glarea lozoyensis ATCC 20868]EPE32010.1 hypothetical protein GLAREA_12092 [Glarea lozoyensis ATCC 20868]